MATEPPFQCPASVPLLRAVDAIADARAGIARAAAAPWWSDVADSFRTMLELADGDLARLDARVWEAERAVRRVAGA